MNQIIFDEDQIHNNTWDEYSNQLICESPIRFGIPYRKKINEDQLSVIYLDYQSDTSENQQSNKKTYQTPHTFKRIQKKSKKFNAKFKTKSISLNNIIEEFTTFVHFSAESKNEQIHYCQKMRMMLENLESILFSIKQEILDLYQKKLSMNN
ncbi:unnamed protein product [Paramecium primaurelia]|uniref:Uncharacterized protein n=1 Tax=Paramecium primaurelia TaxID=5886 RepID=A0A8S1K8V2_PARPR|nr:unnamed protein product [Paramecium primaurelia]